MVNDSCSVSANSIKFTRASGGRDGFGNFHRLAKCKALLTFFKTLKIHGLHKFQSFQWLSIQLASFYAFETDSEFISFKTLLKVFHKFSKRFLCTTITGFSGAYFPLVYGNLYCKLRLQPLTRKSSQQNNFEAPSLQSLTAN